MHFHHHTSDTHDPIVEITLDCSQYLSTAIVIVLGTVTSWMEQVEKQPPWCAQACGKMFPDGIGNSNREEFHYGDEYP